VIGRRKNFIHRSGNVILITTSDYPGSTFYDRNGGACFKTKPENSSVSQYIYGRSQGFWHRGKTLCLSSVSPLTLLPLSSSPGVETWSYVGFCAFGLMIFSVPVFQIKQNTLVKLSEVLFCESLPILTRGNFRH